MSLLHRLSIRTKVVSAFALMLALTLALGAVAVTRLVALKTASSELSDNSMPSIYRLGELETSTLRLFRLHVVHAITNTEQARAEVDRREEMLVKAVADAEAS
jgi:hypothetical protein